MTALQRPVEDIGLITTVASLRRRWRVRMAGLAVGNVAITASVVVVLHVLGLG